MFKKIAAIASALMMTAAPVAASADPAGAVNPAMSLSLAPASRAHGSSKHHSNLFGASALLVAVIVVAGGLGIAAAAGGFNSSSN